MHILQVNMYPIQGCDINNNYTMKYDQNQLKTNSV